MLGGGVALIATALAPASATAKGPPASAHTARAVRASDRAVLYYNRRKSEGAKLVEEGRATGDLPGAMDANLTIEGTFGGSFRLKTSAGWIFGHGTATPSGSGRYESFRGTLQVTGGTGRYAHAHGRAGLYGVLDRDTDEIKIQTTGRLSY
ncbi:MAG TPA: hypothetical protein VGX69_09015 [Solirubrobacteraceae bacterium]|jgi:hypothetical protein|nr:hypothetical protein [Solirubrobacteraceae bacterium]